MHFIIIVFIYSVIIAYVCQTLISFLILLVLKFFVYFIFFSFSFTPFSCTIHTKLQNTHLTHCNHHLEIQNKYGRFYEMIEGETIKIMHKYILRVYILRHVHFQIRIYICGGTLCNLRCLQL